MKTNKKKKGYLRKPVTRTQKKFRSIQNVAISVPIAVDISSALYARHKGYGVRWVGDD